MTRLRPLTAAAAIDITELIDAGPLGSFQRRVLALIGLVVLNVRDGSPVRGSSGSVGGVADAG